jgi:hypothetical protein
MAKFRNTKKGEGKKANATSHNPRIKNPRRDDKKRSAPLSSKAPSTSYLRRSFSERTGEKRKGQPGTEKKVNRDEPGISHHTCNRCEEKKKEIKKRTKTDAPVWTPAWPMWMEITSLIYFLKSVVLGVADVQRAFG